MSRQTSYADLITLATERRAALLVELAALDKAFPDLAMPKKRGRPLKKPRKAWTPERRAAMEASYARRRSTRTTTTDDTERDSEAQYAVV